MAGALKIEVQIAGTTQDAWQWRNVKRKTDKDALKLARLSALGQINCVHIPSPRMRQWRRLIEQRAGEGLGHAARRTGVSSASGGERDGGRVGDRRRIGICFCPSGDRGA